MLLQWAGQDTKSQISYTLGGQNAMREQQDIAHEFSERGRKKKREVLPSEVTQVSLTANAPSGQRALRPTPP